MKRLALFSTLLFLLAISACQHEVAQPSIKAVRGEWQWIYSAGGLTGDSLAPINSTSITLSLNKDSTYMFYLNNIPQDSGRYTIRAAVSNSILHLEHAVAINRLSMEPDLLILQWDNSQLLLMDSNIADGFSHHFKKIQ